MMGLDIKHLLAVIVLLFNMYKRGMTIECVS